MVSLRIAILYLTETKYELYFSTQAKETEVHDCTGADKSIVSKPTETMANMQPHALAATNCCYHHLNTMTFALKHGS